MKNFTDLFYRDPDILGGAFVFSGTRVPVSSLLDYLEAGDSIDLFLDDFSSVRREQVTGFLEITRKNVLKALPA
jgi:uncharacterized protein (DUF433 family)